MKIVTGTEMQKLDRRTIIEAHVPSAVLMERAGEGIVRHLESTVDQYEARPLPSSAEKGTTEETDWLWPDCCTAGMLGFMWCSSHRSLT